MGGLSVWREIVRQLPGEETIYVADQAHVPYGPRPLEEVQRYVEGITRFLLAAEAKAVVVACNSASGAALYALRERFPEVPFVGMEPAVKPAAERTRTGAVGVLATPVTFQGELFQRLVKRFAAGVTVHTVVCPGLVSAVEALALDAPETTALLRNCLEPLAAEKIDQLVLGCTHYPFLADAIRHVVGPKVAIIDPAPAVARQVQRVLKRRGLDRHHGGGAHRFYTSGDPHRLAEQARRLVGYRGTVLGARWNEESAQLGAPSD